MQPRVGAEIREQTRGLARDVDESVDLTAFQLFEGGVLIVVHRLHRNPEAVEQDRGGHRRAAAAHVHVDGMIGQVLELADLLPSEDMDLLVIQLGDVLQRLSAPGNRFCRRI